MELVLIFVGFVLVWLAVTVVKDLDAQAEERSDARFMTSYLKAEDARYHHQRLAAIDATVQATIGEMERITAEAQGEIIEGSCREIESR